ncbi:hypothetical protein [Streptomyces sp. MI02-7b]|uniref:hypothetical protein n=1 Tax=Streptomyces sp. MI02-7b TaxID=462941 RepID=UPI0029B68878|nr:hypothetical protein [Streptomyces sp. MI02-7b]MDX3070972.1 hypothetical protein [Streptomyces sp. MI02-7b]
MHGRLRPAATAVAALLLAALLSACAGTPSGSGAPVSSGPVAARGGSGETAKAPDDTVAGVLGTYRHDPPKTVPATRPRMADACTDRTRRVRHTSSRHSGKRTTTRSRYTTEHYQDCRKVRRGTETYQRVVRAERWCVRLDDVWYRVDAATYDTATNTDRGDRLTITPLGTGCS